MEDSTIDAAQEALRDAEITLRQAEQALTDRVLRAPFAGMLSWVLTDTGASVQAGFFTVDGVVRVRLAQGVDDDFFRRTVDFRDVILGVFLIYLDGIQALDGAENQFTGAAGGAQRDIQHGLHGCVT